MRYYFHILKDRERLRDPDGEEIPDLACARDEARQCARDLMAEELRCGRPVPAHWRIQIAQDDETVLDTVPFAPIVSGEDLPNPRPRPRLTSKHHHEVMARALATSEMARITGAEIVRHVIDLRNNLRTLAELNRSLSRYQRNA